jgi:hypothetical protein
MLRWPPQPLLALQHELHNRFGIDLRQIWAFTYMRRAFLPVMAVVAIVGWSLTGVHEIPLQGRGIYERFGKPVEVFGPGLHAGLPWPLGRVLSVENGVVHELATSVGETSVSVVLEPAEGPAPAIANRLWDASHVNDKSQIGAQALISRERGAAAQATNQAQLQASIARDQASASAHEINSAAQAADLKFTAEQKAYASAGQAFLLEQYFSQLTQGLANAKLLVLDHRLGGTSNAPTIDLRTFTLPADPASPRNSAQPGAAH